MQKRFHIFLAFLIGITTWQANANHIVSAAKTTLANALNSQNTAIQNTATPKRHHYEKVIDVISSHKQQTLIYISLDNGDTITATQGHPFKTTEGWRDAILLKKGGKLLLKGGDDDKPPRPQAGEGWGDGVQTERYATITQVRTEQKVLPVYNLEVANLHTFYVGQDGVVVHNGKAKSPAPGRPTSGNTGGRFKPGAGSGHYKYHPKFKCKGWKDKDGYVWEPNDHNGTHAPH